MRVSKSNGGLSALAVAGTRCILVALDMSATQAADLQGFAFQVGEAGKPKDFLKGKKAYPTHLKPGDPKARYSTQTDPIQSFLWSYEWAEPGTTYDFTVTALHGAVDALRPGGSVDFTVTTEVEDDGRHGVYFNRGAIASQAFAIKFGNKALTPAEESDISLDETKFLSRGLAEGFLEFIDKTKPGESLRGVAYEFSYPLVLRALKGAIGRGVSVEIVRDEKQGKDTDAAIAAAGLDGLVPQAVFERRKAGGIPHNKFIVRLDAAGAAQALWTGSTNFTSSGFLGQTNVGHVVHDAATATLYQKYFIALKGQPAQPQAKSAATKLSPNPANAPAGAIEPIFSPRGADPMMNWYAQRIADAPGAAMITCPFLVDDRVAAAMAVVGGRDNFLLLEKPPKPNVLAAKKANPAGLRIAHGAVLGQTQMQGKDASGKTVTKTVPIPDFELDKWFLEEELARRTGAGFVFFIHAKFLLVDPLSDDPLVCSGSANFSTASQKENDENMLILRGDTRVADIYMTEYDRIFRHFYFRDIANKAARSGQDPNARKAVELDPTPSWKTPYYKANDQKSRLRLMFFKPKKPDWTEAAATDPDVFTTPQPAPSIPGFVKPPPKAKASSASGKSPAKTPSKKTPVRKASKATRKTAKKVVVKKSAAKKAPTKKPPRKAAKKIVKKAAKKSPPKKIARKMPAKKSRRK